MSAYLSPLCLDHGRDSDRIEGSFEGRKENVSKKKEESDMVVSCQSVPRLLAR